MKIYYIEYGTNFVGSETRELILAESMEVAEATAWNAAIELAQSYGPETYGIDTDEEGWEEEYDAEMENCYSIAEEFNEKEHGQYFTEEEINAIKEDLSSSR